MRCFLLLLFLFLFSLFVWAQNKVKIDSLEAALHTASADTHKILILNELGFLYQYTDPEKGMYYARKGLMYAEQKGLAYWQAKCIVVIAQNYESMGNYEKALENNNKALNIYKSLHDEKGISNVYNNIGQVYNYQGEYSKAIDIHLKALAIREKLGDKELISATLNNLGFVYYNLGKYESALDYFQQSLKIDEALGDKAGVSKMLNNIGIVYENQAKYDEALKNYERSFSIKQEIGDNLGTAIALGNIGGVYYNKKDNNKAFYYWNSALQLYKTLNNKSGIANMFQNIGILYAEQKKVHKGIAYIDSSVMIAQNAGLKKNVSEGYNQLADIYAAINDFQKAYEYHKLYSETKDSLLNEESSKQIAEMQTKYETEKKEQQIELLEKDREIQNAEARRQEMVIWSVTGGLLIMISLSIFIFRERRKSEKLLLNILPAETAKELKSKGKASPKHYESVTVMFTDFKGFTAIAEKLSAEELVSELDFIFKKFDEIISRYNIEKIKTIGDAYMCASGLPIPNSNHAEEIVMAGIEIQHWMKEQNGKWNLRIGIHSGPATAGVVGDKKFAYDIWGDTVNIASRMESSGEAGKVNISGSTYELVKEKFNCKFRGKIPAKNKGEIEMYFVERC